MPKYEGIKICQVIQDYATKKTETQGCSINVYKYIWVHINTKKLIKYKDNSLKVQIKNYTRLNLQNLRYVWVHTTVRAGLVSYTCYLTTAIYKIRRIWC